MPGQVSQEALLALELFQLDPKSKKGRELMEQHLVEASMYTRPEARTVGDIAVAVGQVLGEAESFGESECQKVLERCSQLGRVDKLATGQYMLSKAAREQLDTSSEGFRQAERSFSSGLVESVARSQGIVVDALAEAMLVGTVIEVVQQIFYDSAMRLRRLLQGECKDLWEQMDENGAIDYKLGERLRTFVELHKGATIEGTVQGVRAFLSRMDETQRHFIGNLHRRVFYFQMLKALGAIPSLSRPGSSPARSETKFRGGSVSGILEAWQGGTGQGVTPSTG
jgi:hypothetical protein